MIQILLFVIVATFTLSAYYFYSKREAKKKEMVTLIGGLLAAAVGIVMQLAFSLYLALLGILAGSLIATLVYMKLLERENHRNQQLIAERKAQKSLKSSRAVSVAEKTIYEQQVPKSFEIQTINADREEQKVGQ